MDIESKNENGIVTITPHGSINSVTADELDEAVNSFELPKINSLVFDFADVDYISSKCLRVLVSTYKKMQDKPIQIANPNTSVVDILRMSGLADIFQIQ